MDVHQLAAMSRCAAEFAKLAAACGVSASIEVSQSGHYIANGTDCGTSVHGLYEWLHKHPNYKV